MIECKIMKTMKVFLLKSFAIYSISSYTLTIILHHVLKFTHMMFIICILILLKQSSQMAMSKIVCTCTNNDSSSKCLDQMTQNNNAYNSIKGTDCYILRVLSKCNYYMLYELILPNC